MKAVLNSTSPILVRRRTSPKFLLALMIASFFVLLAWRRGTAVRSLAASFPTEEREPHGQHLSDRGVTELRTVLNALEQELAREHAVASVGE